MENETGSDLLVENLIRLGLNPATYIIDKSIFPGNDRFLNSKFVLTSLPDSIYLLASDTYGSKAYASSTYTGLYSSIDLPPEATCKILKKDWFDPIIYFKRRKTGISEIDKKLTIISSGWVPSKVLNSESVNLFLALNESGNPYHLIIQNDYLPQIDTLKGKKVMGIETNQWIYEMDDIKNLIDSGGALIKQILKAIA